MDFGFDFHGVLIAPAGEEASCADSDGFLLECSCYFVVEDEEEASPADSDGFLIRGGGRDFRGDAASFSSVDHRLIIDFSSAQGPC